MASALRGCIEAKATSIAPGACGGFELGSLATKGVGLEGGRSDRSLWLAPTLDGTARFGLARDIALRAAIGGGIPLTQTTFYAEGTNRDLHRTGAVFARASLGLDVSLR